ncbi:hypothetical protein [Marinomonas sp. 2405UD68-3]|uniref:hypothetical protein n=1 Tax=Marinomonas sp. 2405UD68-3 TaxID=3391835 RepID=UPI0039C9C343
MTDKNLLDQAIESMNDAYIILSDNTIVYLSHKFYSDPSRIIESVSVDGEFVKRFFLDNNGVYPLNLLGPAVSKVLEWNLEGSNGDVKSFDSDADLGIPQTGYFIDLRQLNMSRLNMIKISGAHNSEADIPITNLSPVLNGANSVPKDKLYQLSQIPAEDNLYIAYFQEPDRTHSNTECYSYNVSYISASELNDHIYNPTSNDTQHFDTTAYLKNYYGEAGVQAGSINPNDLGSEPSLIETNELKSTQLVGLTCYIANLKAFKK